MIEIGAMIRYDMVYLFNVFFVKQQLGQNPWSFEIRCCTYIARFYGTVNKDNLTADAILFHHVDNAYWYKYWCFAGQFRGLLKTLSNI